MRTGMFHTHYLTVVLFLILYVIKTILLLSGREALLDRFSKLTRIPEMIISVLFLLTGIYLMTQLPLGGGYDFLLWIKICLVLVSIPLAVVGFKRKNKILAALSLLCITASFGLAESYHKRKAYVQNTGVQSAGALYRSNCSVCHGNAGDAGLAGAKNIKTTELKESEIIKLVLNGKNTMPPANLTPEQAQSVARFVLDSLKTY